MSTQSINKLQGQANLWRRVLRGNGLFSGISGLVLLVGAQPVAAFLGLEWPVALMSLGVTLLAFAAVLFWITAQESVARPFVQFVFLLDVAWVVGSAAILLAGWLPLTVAGKWVVALLAEVVAIFAALEGYVLWQDVKRKT
jgi:hypothetical protein